MNIFVYLLPQRRLMVGVFCLCAAAGASAISLGPNTHSATLGKPLDLSVKMMLDAGEDPKALCLDASVFYVDRQLDSSKIQVTAEPSTNVQESVIRIRSALPVEGPVVTLNLRAGCAKPTARRYVVLAAAMRLPVAGAESPEVQMVSASLAGDSSEKAQEQERELRQLQADLLKAQTALAQNSVQLQSAQAQGFRKELVFGVVGLLCFTFAALLFLLRQKPREAPPTSSGAVSGAGLLSESAATSGSGSELDVTESLFDQFKRRPARSTQPAPHSIPPLARQDRAKFSVSVPFVPRTVRIPEIFDLQQQVEFFGSLGQQDKAIALLRNHLVANVKTSALVYLDLLDLYHQTDDRQAYEVLREDFNRVFNTQIAPFDSYSAAGTNFSYYEDVLARIEAAWPKRRVFDIIDKALFREPGNPAEVLDLEAYRELLLLHAVAREIIDLDADSGDSNGSSQWPDLSMNPPPSPRLGLDIDLNQLGDSDKPAKRVSRTRERSQEAPAPARSADAPAVFDSLVDFDDHDTGFRPDDLGRKV